ncbi:site-specific integrase [Mesorhizobium sp.]|uniref:site-specific integrase n=1 Tax=Mesorhizobium sp. TaxID=1871066 RepID=UPI0025E16685|nr:site-specific integrase [Mesorhizobium sp.]
MRYDELRAALKRHFQEALQRRKDQIAAQGRLGPDEITALQVGLAFAEEAISTGGDMSPAETDDDLAARFAELYKLSLVPGTPAYASFKKDMQRAYKAYCTEVLNHDQSFDNFDLNETGLPQLNSAKLAVGPKDSLNEVASKFIAEEKKAGRWVRRSEEQKRQHLELLNEILGRDIEITQVASSDAQRVKEILLNYPRNRNKIEATRNLSIEEISKLRGHETLTIRTINTYLQTYAGLFSWAKRNRYVAENLFDGATLRENKKNDEEAQREPFSQAHIDLMLSELLENARGLLNKEYQKWGPLIGLYTGARLNEICQLEIADIEVTDGIWCFDFNDEGEGKSLKNSASRRVVPIHDRLLELGILGHLQALKSRGETRLFPEFQRTSKEGYGRALGRWFNERFLVQLGIKSKDLVFHSFRHTMITKLLQAGVEENLVKAIVGHTRHGVTQQHYFKQGYTIAQMQAALRSF